MSGFELEEGHATPAQRLATLSGFQLDVEPASSLRQSALPLAAIVPLEGFLLEETGAPSPSAAVRSTKRRRSMGEKHGAAAVVSTAEVLDVDSLLVEASTRGRVVLELFCGVGAVAAAASRMPGNVGVGLDILEGYDLTSSLACEVGHARMKTHGKGSRKSV